MKPPFFICAPRTRSTILFEALTPYVEKHMGLRRIRGHTELFLEVSANAVFTDAKTNHQHSMQLMGVANGPDIDIHYVYPPLYQDTATGVRAKLQLLQQQRLLGYEYFIKGTLEVTDALNDVLEFYKGYQIVVSMRRDLTEYCLSSVTAWYSRIFHARQNNVDYYRQVLYNGVDVDLVEAEQWLTQLLRYTKACWEIPNKIEATVVWYEDMSDWSGVVKAGALITNDANWIDHVPEDHFAHLPIKVDKNYERILPQYDGLLLVIDRVIDKVWNGSSV